jgi:hypothetical protein
MKISCSANRSQTGLQEEVSFKAVKMYLGHTVRHLYGRRDNSFDNTQERLSSSSTASRSSRKLYTLHQSQSGFRITRPSATITHCATADRKSHELCKSSVFELPPVCNIVRGIAGRPHVACAAFVGTLVIKR